LVTLSQQKTSFVFRQKRFFASKPQAWYIITLRDDSIPQQVADGIQGFALICLREHVFIQNVPLFLKILALSNFL
jgi:hypothetical protein